MDPLGIYIHVPFCKRKCAYCDFNAYSGLGSLAAPYVRALEADIRSGPHPGRLVQSVFFGGGTPTFLPAPDLARLLDAVASTWSLQADAEVTVEANPTSADARRFAELRRAGFNRVSIGVQAFDDDLLRAVDREHTAAEAVAAVDTARKARFDNVSLDLMFGLPGQTQAQWEATLERALELGTPHLSVYALTLEPGTRFERLHAGGKLVLPGEEAELAMYESAITRLREAGFEHYEVSNFAWPGYRARHNLLYWRNGEYLGFGAGAVSYVDGRRWTREKQPGRYIQKVGSGADLAVEAESLDGEAAVAETLILGLRLLEGLDLRRVARRFGAEALSTAQEHLDALEREGYLRREGDRVRVTHRGLLFSDHVALQLLPDPSPRRRTPAGTATGPAP